MRRLLRNDVQSIYANICLQFHNKILNSGSPDSFFFLKSFSYLTFSVLLYITDSYPRLMSKLQLVNSLVGTQLLLLQFSRHFL